MLFVVLFFEIQFLCSELALLIYVCEKYIVRDAIIYLANVVLFWLRLVMMTQVSGVDLTEHGGMWDWEAKVVPEQIYSPRIRVVSFIWCQMSAITTNLTGVFELHDRLTRGSHTRLAPAKRHPPRSPYTIENSSISAAHVSRASQGQERNI